MVNVHIRWLIRCDMPCVLDIENKSFRYSWSEGDFMDVLRQRNCIGMVAEQSYAGGCAVNGFVIYELCKSKLRILNFAVHPDHRRRGVGRAMIHRLKEKLSVQRRVQLCMMLSEDNDGGHLFLKAMGFRCVGIERGAYAPPINRDGYRFVYDDSFCTKIAEHAEEARRVDD